jgi:beta-lactamase superfamily II metal-dependent hydrolase
VVIKGRHGAEASGTDALLDAIQPAVVIQAGAGRPHSHDPVHELRERLESRAIQFYRTEQVGAVTVRVTPAGYAIQTCLAPTGAAR